MNPAKKIIKEHGQAALDFITEYGWALALVVIIAAVLFALGIFDPGAYVSNKSSGFSGVSVSGWQLYEDGSFAIKVSNQVGKEISLDSIAVETGRKRVEVSGLPMPLSPGQVSPTLFSPTGLGEQVSGGTYTARIAIAYTDSETAFQYNTAGMVIGKVRGGGTGLACATEFESCKGTACCGGFECVDNICLAGVRCGSSTCAPGEQCCQFGSCPMRLSCSTRCPMPAISCCEDNAECTEGLDWCCSPSSTCQSGRCRACTPPDGFCESSSQCCSGYGCSKGVCMCAGEGAVCDPTNLDAVPCCSGYYCSGSPGFCVAYA